MLVCFILKLSAIRVKIRSEVKCVHSPAACFTGENQYGARCFLSPSHAIFPAYYNLYINFLTSANTFPFFEIATILHLLINYSGVKCKSVHVYWCWSRSSLRHKSLLSSAQFLALEFNMVLLSRSSVVVIPIVDVDVSPEHCSLSLLATIRVLWVSVICGIWLQHVRASVDLLWDGIFFNGMEWRMLVPCASFGPHPCESLPSSLEN